MITIITEMATSIAAGREPQSQPVLEEQTAQTSNKYFVVLFLFILSVDVHSGIILNFSTQISKYLQKFLYACKISSQTDKKQYKYLNVFFNF